MLAMSESSKPRGTEAVILAGLMLLGGLLPLFAMMGDVMFRVPNNENATIIRDTDRCVRNKLDIMHAIDDKLQTHVASFTHPFVI